MIQLLAMSPALWGLVGTVVGGVLAMVGSVLMQRLAAAEQAQAEQRQVQEVARAERKLAYIRLLTAARRLRYLARPESTIDPGELDSLRTDLSSLNYEIELIAAPDVVFCSNHLRRKTMDYLNAARTTATGTSSRPEEVTALRLAARKAVDEFIAAARSDLVTDASPAAKGAPRRSPH